MSLVRGLTKRYNHIRDEMPSIPSLPGRNGTVKKQEHTPMPRPKISLPIELISTTNSLAYSAPDLALPHLNTTNHVMSSSLVTSPSSPCSSHKSYNDDSDGPGLSSSSSMTSPDLSREPTPSCIEPNHLTAYFRDTISSTSSHESTDMSAPAVPTRAMSHTKKTHQILARQRSLSRIRSPVHSVSSSSGLRASTTSADVATTTAIESAHPFGAELAQVNELAEEYSSKASVHEESVTAVEEVRVWDEDERYLNDNGLCKFSVEDYLCEIKPLFHGWLGRTAPLAWI